MSHVTKKSEFRLVVYLVEQRLLQKIKTTTFFTSDILPVITLNMQKY